MLGPRSISIGLGLLLVGSALMLGSVHPTAGLLLGAGSLALASALSLRRESVPAPAWGFWALSAYTGLQAIPLPLSWLVRIAPENADVWSRALLPLGEAAPRYASISLAPQLTLLNCVLWWSYGVVCWAAHASARQLGRPRALLLAVGASVVVTLVTLAHGLVAAQSVYGLYRPSFHVERWLVGPLLNGNNLAGYANVGALVALGLLLSAKPPAPRWVLGSALGLCGAMTWITGSTGGLVALLVGASLVIGMYAWFTRRSRALVHIATLGSLLVLGGGAAAIGLHGNKLWRTSGGADLDKLEFVIWSKPLLADYGILGVGRGAYEGVFQAYSQPLRDIAVRSPENFIVQWASEWGVPATAAAVLGLAYCIWSLTRQKRDLGARAGALGAVLALLLHNLVDLGLEVPALCMLLSAVLGASCRTAEPPTDRLRRSEYSALALGTLFLVLGVAVKPRAMQAERDLVHAAYQEALRAKELDVVTRRIRDALLRFPAEPYFSRIGALAAWRLGGDPMPWLQRALERGMNNGRTHLILAEVLLAHGNASQGLLELRWAMDLHQDLIPTGVSKALSVSRDPDVLSRVVPEGRNRSQVLFMLAAGVKGPPKELFLRQAIEAAPTFARSRRLLALEFIEQLEAGASGTCAERVAACKAEVMSQAGEFANDPALLATACSLRARVARLDKDWDRMDRELAACLKLPEPGPCLPLRVELAIHRDAGAAGPLSERLLAEHCRSKQECGTLAAQFAAVFARLGQREESWKLQRRSATELDTLAAWLLAAKAAEYAGHASDSLRILVRCRHRYPGSSEVEEQLTRLKQKPQIPSPQPVAP